MAPQSQHNSMKTQRMNLRLTVQTLKGLTTLGVLGTAWTVGRLEQICCLCTVGTGQHITVEAAPAAPHGRSARALHWQSCECQCYFNQLQEST